MSAFSRHDQEIPLAGGISGNVGAAGHAVDEDQALVNRCRAGDVDAFGLLIARHERRVHAILTHVLMSGASPSSKDLELDDLAQEVFLLAWKNLPKFRGESRFSTWLFRIATNRAIKEYRDRRRASLTSLSDQPNEISSDVVGEPGNHDPQILIESMARNAALRQAVDRLTERQRIVVILHYFEEYRCEEIASILECSIGTVWSRLHYACKRLKEELGWMDDSGAGWEAGK
jgi:RNA polymerase sigma-70 factor (ECF subfamily)